MQVQVGVKEEGLFFPDIESPSRLADRKETATYLFSESEINAHHPPNEDRFFLWRVNLRELPITWWVNVCTKINNCVIKLLSLITQYTQVCNYDIYHTGQGRAGHYLPSMNQLQTR